MRHYKAFQGRVPRETICSVQSGARNLTDRIQPSQACRTICLRFNPAALIMRCRYNRNRLLRHVDAESQTRLVNVRETLPNEFRRLVRENQKHAFPPRGFNPRTDRWRYDVARSDRAARVVALHEIFASTVAQNSAF